MVRNVKRRARLSHVEPGEINHFRARFEMLANEAGLTLSYIARDMGISTSTLTEALDRGNPTEIYVDRFSDYFKVPRKVWTKKVTPREYGEQMLPRG